MRYRAAIPLLSVFIGLLLANFAPVSGLVAAGTVTNPSGYIDLPFKYTPKVQTPTGEKPQSKLWYNDGRWWGSLFNNSAGKYHIYWLNTANQTWIDTGTVLDPRPQTKADCLWDGTHLYIASGGGSDLSGSGTIAPLDAWLFRYSYNAAAKNYTLDFSPVTIRGGGAETIVIDKDTAGVLWITYTQGNKVYINHSRASDADWDPSAAQVVPAAGANPYVTPDDISTLVAFDGKIGVLWSNESSGQFSGSSDTAFYFALHVDGAPDTSWDGGVALRQPEIADDHLNIKSLQSDASGNVFAMVKTSINANGNPQLLLLVAKKQADGSYKWSWYTESMREDGQTRPILLIDTSNRMLYVFTSTESGGNVYYKSTSIDTIQLPSGAGSLFMSKPGYAINNVTSTKQTVNSATGIVVLASHDNECDVDTAQADYYFHNYISLGGPLPTAIPRTPTPTPTTIPNPTPVPTVDPGKALKPQVYIPAAQR
jgi:hypothetical protein